ncbi:MAG: hypothetical protein AAFQ67_01705, partial [Pseudomonadota bacterium]
MLVLEALLRFGSIGILIAISALILRDGWRVRAFRIALLLNLSLICVFLTTGTAPLKIEGLPAFPLRLFDMMVVVFIWWFGQALFDEGFRLGPLQWAVFVGYAAVQGSSRAYDFFGVGLHPLGWAGYVISWSVLAMMGHLIYKALAERDQDLVEARRRSRIWFAIAIGIIGALSVLSEDVLQFLGTTNYYSLFITYVLTFVAAIWAVLWLTRLLPEVISFEPVRQVEPVVPAVDPKDAVAHGRLMSLVRDERAYTEPGLSIGALAERVGVPEHRLRALINRSMGYRNFASFLNHFRIDEA